MLTADEANPASYPIQGHGVRILASERLLRVAISWYDACNCVCASEICDRVDVISASSAEETCEVSASAVFASCVWVAVKDDCVLPSTPASAAITSIAPERLV